MSALDKPREANGMESNLRRAAALLAASERAAALTGAGMSAESGVPTFRGAGGLWTRLGEPSVNGYKRFLTDPAGWWRHQLDPRADPARTELRRAIDSAKPNAGHYALAAMERAGIVKAVITQNVDGLHRAAGSERVIELHGNRHMARCVSCGSRRARDAFSYEVLPPTCPDCGGLVKGDTVMFGEPIPPSAAEASCRAAAACDCMIVCGTSATVYPAANFPRMVKANGGALIEVNPNPTPLSDFADVVLRGASGEVLPRLAQLAGAR